MQKEIVPAFADWTDDAAVADLDDLHLMHVIGERDGLGQPHGLALVAFEYGRAGHLVYPSGIYIQSGPPPFKSLDRDTGAASALLHQRNPHANSRPARAATRL